MTASTFRREPAPAWPRIARGNAQAVPDGRHAVLGRAANAKSLGSPARPVSSDTANQGLAVPHWLKEYCCGRLDGEEAKIVRQEMTIRSARAAAWFRSAFPARGGAPEYRSTDAQKRLSPEDLRGLISLCQAIPNPTPVRTSRPLPYPRRKRWRTITIQRPERSDILRQLRRLDFLPGVAQPTRPAKNMTASALSCF